MKIHANLIKSPRKNKAYRMVFTNDKHEVISYTDFGSYMDNFTLHKDVERKQRFLNRFQKLIEKYKNDPQAPMTLSTWVLWHKPTLEASIRDYKKHFGLT